MSEFYEIDEKDLLSSSRRQEIVKARQMAMYLLRTLLKVSFPGIARFLGGKDHTTVMYAYDKVAREVESRNETFVQEIELLKTRVS